MSKPHTLQHLVNGSAKITETKNKDGLPQLKIDFIEHSPKDINLIDYLTGLSAFCIWAGVIYLGLSSSQSFTAEGFIALLAAGIGAQIIIGVFWKSLITTKSIVYMTPFNVRFRGLDGKKKLFDRNVRRKYEAGQDHEAREEKRKHEHMIREAAKRRKSINPKPIYQESFIVCFSPLEQRHAIAHIYGNERARDMIAALNLCDGYMDNYLKHGEAKEEEWSPSAGRIHGGQ